ncbi:hypothetical protein POPTR_008G084200v4 [Populus trichocarpa]|uniref:Uncharacterized protein n=1 Tax=Populus trichocarpa TaxID=3694 RepID=A0ACC0SKH1_POPTR|nr:uncharacterized protein LOC7460677 [Populus trichocarpa]KAI9389730.1 hypothetical protein POPTR_008G084200v4 [Populus trichocarpa]
MGIWDYINSSADLVNRRALTPTKNICWNSFSYGRAAVTRIDTAVRVNAIPALNKRLQDEETRAMMSHVTINCAKNAAIFAFREGVKIVPGGAPVYEIVSKSIGKKGVAGDSKEKTNKLEAEVEVLKKEINELKRLSNQCEASDYMNGCGSTARVDCFEQPKVVNKTLQGAVVRSFMNTQQPDSAIRRFMMEGFAHVLEYEVKSENEQPHK